MLSSKRPQTTSGGGGAISRRCLRSTGAATVDDGLACSRCTEPIPYRGTYAELRPCCCPVCVECLASAHARRGGELLTCCDAVVTSHVLFGAERVPQGNEVKYNIESDRVRPMEATNDMGGVMGRLPPDALTHIASYLTKTTRALFAVALTAPSSSWDKCDGGSRTMSSASKTVMEGPYYGPCTSNDFEQRQYYYDGSCGSKIAPYQYQEEWEDLNFFDVEESVRIKLIDGDISGILTCIDAWNKLKNLRLPHCVSVRGHGLAPLRGSIVLERVDLSFVSIKNERPIDRKSALLEDAVIPILDSIVSKAGHAFHRLHLPKFWCERTSYGLLSQFVRVKGNRNLMGYAVGCRECDYTFRYSSRSFTISHEKGEGLIVCPECDAKYCKSHGENSITECDKCRKPKCEGCSVFFYGGDCCDRTLCGACSNEIYCEGANCVGAGASNCGDCAGGQHGIKQCKLCDTTQCDQCKDFRFSSQLQGYVCADCV